MLCDISIFVMTFVTLIPQMMIVANSLNVLSFITLPFLYKTLLMGVLIVQLNLCVLLISLFFSMQD